VTGGAGRLAPPPSRPGSFAHLQALDDAMSYRAARVRAPCRRCRPCKPCDAHACDLNLLDAYREMAEAAVAALPGVSSQTGTKKAELADAELPGQVEETEGAVRGGQWT